ERGKCRSYRVAEHLRKRVAGTVAAGLRHGTSAGGEDDLVRANIAVDDETRLDRFDTHVRDDVDALRRAKQRIDDVARAIADREKFPRLLALQLHSQLFEKCDGGRNIER